jgi:hypothetical protein
MKRRIAAALAAGLATLFGLSGHPASAAPFADVVGTEAGKRR